MKNFILEEKADKLLIHWDQKDSSSNVIGFDFLKDLKELIEKVKSKKPSFLIFFSKKEIRILSWS